MMLFYFIHDYESSLLKPQKCTFFIKLASNFSPKARKHLIINYNCLLSADCSCISCNELFMCSHKRIWNNLQFIGVFCKKQFYVNKKKYSLNLRRKLFLFRNYLRLFTQSSINCISSYCWSMRQNVIKQIIYWQNNAISVSDKNWLLDRQLSVSGVLNKKREKQRNK